MSYPDPNRMTTAQAIEALRAAWCYRQTTQPMPEATRAGGIRIWNEICDVLGFADRFKL